jgi:hypothetical protein
MSRQITESRQMTWIDVVGCTLNQPVFCFDKTFMIDRTFVFYYQPFVNPIAVHALAITPPYHLRRREAPGIKARPFQQHAEIGATHNITFAILNNVDKTTLALHTQYPQYLHFTHAHAVVVPCCLCLLQRPPTAFPRAASRAIPCT